VSTRTFGNEDSLPRLPLPTLEESCEGFLEWCAPLLTRAELAATGTAVASFLRPGGPARKLQATLERYDASGGVHSWLDTFWRDRYLGRRDRIALNANFFALFNHSGQQRVERAAGLLAAAVNYKLLLEAERIPPAVRRGRALSMELHKSLFSATRIPGLARDTIRAPYSEGWPGPSQERHIVVFFRGNLFQMDVIGPHGHPHTLDDLTAGLHAVMTAGATEAAPGAAVGHLTTKPRAEWAVSRQALLDRHRSNARLLDVVETALFCLCLEDAAPKSPVEACQQLLHGDSRNRWFDKALSFISFPDGTAGINVEHSGLDGNTIVNFADTLLGRTAAEHSRQSGARPQGIPAIERITFALDARLVAVLAAWPANQSPARPPTPPPACCPSTISARTGPNGCGCRPTRSCRWHISSPTSGPGDSSAPRTSRSPPTTTGTGARKQCASSPPRQSASWPRWTTRTPARRPAGQPFAPPPNSM